MFLISSKENAKVLLVDDDPMILETLKERLEVNNYKVFTSLNGAEGLKIFYAEKPDIVITDLRMPVMDGLELIDRIRHGQERQDIPVIVLSATENPKDLSRAMELHVERFLVKPFELTELLGILDELSYVIAETRQS